MSYTESNPQIGSRLRRIFLNKLFLASITTFLVIGIALVIFPQFIKNSNRELKNSSQTDNGNVLGSSARTPQIYISGNGEGYSTGGVIELASTDEPAVRIGGYNISGTAEIALYQSNDDALLDYITHDKDGKQLKKTPDGSKIRFVTNIKKDINLGNNNEEAKISLPLSEKGIWYLKIKIGSIETSAFIVRSSIGAIANEGDNEFIFWGQNLKTKRSLTEGIVIPYNLQNGRRELARSSFNSDGIAKSPLTKDADVALVAQNDDRALIPINLKYLNVDYNYQVFQEKVRKTKYFIFTDRPLYKPGDTVYFKAVLRDDDDARYSIPAGDASVKIYDGYYYEGSSSNPAPEFEGNFGISSDGTINGQYKIPSDAKVGYRSLHINVPNQSIRSGYYDGEYSSNSISFDVEFFKKPEFSIEVTTPKHELIAGDKTSFKINGQYFSGQPLANQKVKYTVYSGDFFEYQYLTDIQNLKETISNDFRYGSWGSNKVTEGTANLNKNGEIEINLDTKLPFAKGKTQVFSIEAVIDDGSVTPSFSRKNVLVYAGEYGIYRKDFAYGSKVNTPLSIPVALAGHRGGINVSGINLTAKVHRENWISYQDPNNKYPSYKKEEEDLPEISSKTDGSGNAIFFFTPSKTGSYTITVNGKDSRENDISKIFYSYVSAQDYPYYNTQGNNDLTVSVDKQKYKPTDTVKLNIFSYIPNRDVFLSMERGRTNRYQVVHLNGKNGSIDINLENTDIPNIYAKATSFDDNSLNTGMINIPVTSESKKLNVKVTPSNKTFGPGETVSVNIETFDISGNPLSADLALWAVDKAIFEISDNRLGNIFDTFWNERNNSTVQAHSLEGILAFDGGRGGGCFAAGTKVLMADGKLKDIEDVRIGDYVLTRTSDSDTKLIKAEVIKTHEANEGGYLIINGNLKVTADHMIWVNKTWKEAGSIQLGDKLANSQGRDTSVRSIEWQREKIKVYNLEIDSYHTYFANGLWVHNQKGIERSVFKDTAYWNPSVHTDSSGKAQISFKIPDNLTTWTIAAVASTTDTKVGQTTNEIVVTKDVIVRPILPNILRVGDEIILSALVQNFTTSDQNFDINLNFDSGEVEQPSRPDTEVKANEIKQIYWKVKPKKENENSKFVFNVKSKAYSKLSDIVTQEIPVRSFEFEEKRAEAGEGNKNYKIKFANDSNKVKSQVTLSLSSTILGTLPAAMKYLINYPYGCVEQTTSRFVPAVIAKINSGLFASSAVDKNINEVIQKGINKLSSQQQGDGGWTWWFSGRSDPFVTAYVVEYALMAKQAGVKVDSEMFERAQRYLEQGEYYDYIRKQKLPFNREEVIAKNYGLTLLGAREKLKKITDLNNLSADMLSMVVISNYLNGDKNSQTNGLDILMSMAKTQGDAVFWEAGNKINFGSKDASTAWAIRAILTANGDRSVAVKAARYLTRTRKFDYWSNTYATAQVVRALTELSKTGSELSPNYTYKVTLDGKQIAQGAVNDSQLLIKDIAIPVSSIKKDGSSISISKSGEGQIYSTLLINELRTDKNADALDHGISVERQYINEKGEGSSLGVGDIAIVKITVNGLKAIENYAVIKDELPSGLIPINEAFKNEQYGQESYIHYYSSFDVTDKEITENGAILSLYQIAAGKRTYTYRARVVNEGKFVVPPATASLMYAPEIYGRSEAQMITVSKESQAAPIKSIENILGKYGGVKVALIGISIILFIVGVAIAFLKKMGFFAVKIKTVISKFSKKENSPPAQDPQ